MITLALAAERMPLWPHQVLGSIMPAKLTIVEWDGEKFPVTRDSRPDRLNFVIEKRIFTHVTTG